jgi:predicted nucleic acid-binding protein
VIVLDTNVLSELVRERPDARVLAWLDDKPVAEIATTAVTTAEMLYGVARLPSGRRKAELEQAVRAMIDEDFRDRVEYALVVAGRDRLGRPISVSDAQIAAICRARGAALATRNTKDFEDTGIELIDPWQPQ